MTYLFVILPALKAERFSREVVRSLIFVHDQNAIALIKLKKGDEFIHSSPLLHTLTEIRAISRLFCLS